MAMKINAQNRNEDLTIDSHLSIVVNVVNGFERANNLEQRR